jgi:hypothetical protein
MAIWQDNSKQPEKIKGQEQSLTTKAKKKDVHF